MRPNSVCAPTAVTTINPVPAVIKLPECSIFVRSATGVVRGKTASAALPTGADSPVRADSSATSPWASKRRPSAISLSPVPTKTRSPTTNASCEMRTRFPPRSTAGRTVAPIARNASKALALRPSIVTEIPTDSKIAITTPAHSAKSVCPSVNKCTRFTTAKITTAMTSSSVIGSAKASSTRRHNGTGRARASTFSPKRCRCASICASFSKPTCAVTPSHCSIVSPKSQCAVARRASPHVPHAAEPTSAFCVSFFSVSSPAGPATTCFVFIDLSCFKQ